MQKPQLFIFYNRFLVTSAGVRFRARAPIQFFCFSTSTESNFRWMEVLALDELPLRAIAAAAAAAAAASAAVASAAVAADIAAAVIAAAMRILRL